MKWGPLVIGMAVGYFVLPHVVLMVFSSNLFKRTG